MLSNMLHPCTLVFPYLLLILHLIMLSNMLHLCTCVSLPTFDSSYSLIFQSLVSSNYSIDSYGPLGQWNVVYGPLVIYSGTNIKCTSSSSWRAKAVILDTLKY